MAALAVAVLFYAHKLTRALEYPERIWSRLGVSRQKANRRRARLTSALLDAEQVHEETSDDDKDAGPDVDA